MKTLSLTPRAALVAVAVWFIASATPATRAAESLSVLLQKAIYAEETEGNLDSAIKLYEQIKTEGVSNRSLIAQAVYRLAVCHQKQGNRDLAITVLNELVRQFPLETALAQKAREQLAALGQPTEAVTLRRIGVVNNSWIRVVSPDGKFIAYTGTDGEVLVQELSTRRTWTAVRSNWDTSPWCFVFSADGRSIAYELGGERRGKALVVASIDGSDAKEIYKPEENATIYPHRWIPGTDNILCMLEEQDPRARKAVVINSKSRALTRSSILPSTNNTYWTASVNGRYFAMRDGSRLALIDVESGREETIVEDNVTRNAVGWAHDDAGLFFTSDRTGVRSLWMIPIQAGKASGEPTMVKELGTEAEFIDATPDGQIFYAEDNNTANVCVVTANLENGEILNGPRLVTDRFPGRQTTPAWSSDGKKLWLASQGEQRRYIAVSLNTGKQEDFPLAHGFTHRLWDYSPATDASFLLIEARRTDKPSAYISTSTLGIHRYETATGKIETLLASKNGNTVRRPRVSPDGKSFYYTRELREQLPTGKDDPQKRRILIVRRDLLSGNEQIIRESTGARIIWRRGGEISPDGLRLAYLTTDDHLTKDFVVALEIMDLRTGQTREILRRAPREYISSIAWTPDGKRLVYSTWTPATGSADGVQSANSSGLRAYPKPNAADTGQTAIWSQGVESGQSVKLKLALPDLEDVAVGPGGQVAFRTGSIGDTAQIWVMEGLSTAATSGNDMLHRGKPLAKMPSNAIPLQNILGPDNTINDRERGFSATVPAGWSVRSAQHRDNGVVLVALNPAPKIRDASLVTIAYRSMLPWDDAVFSVFPLKGLGPKPETPTDIAAWMRSFARAMEGQRRERTDGKYQNRATSLRARVVQGQPALSWIGDYTDPLETRSECFTVIFGKGAVAWAWFSADRAEIDRIQPDLDNLIGSVSLP